MGSIVDTDSNKYKFVINSKTICFKKEFHFDEIIE